MAKVCVSKGKMPPNDWVLLLHGRNLSSDPNSLLPIISFCCREMPRPLLTLPDPQTLVCARTIPSKTSPLKRHLYILYIVSDLGTMISVNLNLFPSKLCLFSNFLLLTCTHVQYTEQTLWCETTSYTMSHLCSGPQPSHRELGLSVTLSIANIATNTQNQTVILYNTLWRLP